MPLIFSITKAFYMLSIFRNMFLIKKLRPHLQEKKSCHLQFCESQNKDLKFKFMNNSKICAFDFFYYEPIFNVINVHL